MGSRARASGVPRRLGLRPGGLGRAPRPRRRPRRAPGHPHRPSTRVSASSTAPSVLDAALGPRDRAAAAGPRPCRRRPPPEKTTPRRPRARWQRASAMDEVAGAPARARARRRGGLDAAAQRGRDGGAAGPGAHARGAAPTVIVDRGTTAAPRPPARGPAHRAARRRPAPTQQYAAPAAAPAVVDAAPAAAVAEESVAAPLVRKTPIGALQRSSAARSSSCSPSWRRRRSAGRRRASPPRSSAPAPGAQAFGPSN